MKDYRSAASNVDKINGIKGGVIFDDELRKILADLFIDNVIDKTDEPCYKACSQIGHAS